MMIHFPLSFSLEAIIKYSELNYNIICMVFLPLWFYFYLKNNNRIDIIAWFPLCPWLYFS